MAAKNFIGYVKLQIPAGKANPSPPIGPALAQKGLNIMEFCKAFNAQTQSMEPGTPVRVLITAYSDKSFNFLIKTPPVSHYIKKASGIGKGSPKAGISQPVGSITREQVLEIAEIKMQDLNAWDVEAASKMVIGSARSMGVRVVD
jgi:large subunit ribosomal protein L11